MFALSCSAVCNERATEPHLPLHIMLSLRLERFATSIFMLSCLDRDENLRIFNPGTWCHITSHREYWSNLVWNVIAKEKKSSPRRPARSYAWQREREKAAKERPTARGTPKQRQQLAKQSSL